MSPAVLCTASFQEMFRKISKRFLFVLRLGSGTPTSRHAFEKSNFAAAPRTNHAARGYLNYLAVVLARCDDTTNCLSCYIFAFAAMRRSRGTNWLALHNRDNLRLLTPTIPCPLKGHLSSACGFSCILTVFGC